MKKISAILFTFCLTMAFGQRVSDYKYVSVPEKFETFKKNQYGLDVSFPKLLKQKKYIVLSTNKESLLSDENIAPCSIISGEVIDDSNFLKNRVLISFKDCNGKTILESKGSSSIKDFEEGFDDALKKAMVNIPVSNPSANNLITITTENKEVKEATIATIDNTPTTSVAQTSTKFSNGKITLQKIQLDDKQFILADANSSVPYATFRSTDKKDVFRVKLANGESTLGYFENGKIIIEIPQANGDYSKEIFSGK